MTFTSLKTLFSVVLLSLCNSSQKNPNDVDYVARNAETSFLSEVESALAAFKANDPLSVFAPLFFLCDAIARSLTRSLAGQQ